MTVRLSFGSKILTTAHGTRKVKLRPTAQLETPMKLIESNAVDQVAGHFVTLMQTEQVGFKSDAWC